MNSSDSFPLKWPQVRPRTEIPDRKRAPFKTSMARARDGLLAELKRMRASDVVISTNVETYMRGKDVIPYANQTRYMEDPGVAVYYMWRGEQYCLSCDKYKAVMDNMQAINKTVEAIRGIERWGTGEMMRAAFAGFKELPPGNPDIKPTFDAWAVLGVKPGATADDVRTAYRAKIKLAHPDAPTGSAEEFMKVQKAYEIVIAS